MNGRQVLRAIAIAIAVAGAADPAITRTVRLPERLTIVAMSDDVLDAARRLQAQAPALYTAQVHRHAAASGAAACPATGVCVIVTQGDVPDRLTAGALVAGAIDVGSAPARVIRAADAPQRVHVGAPAAIALTLARPVPRVEVFDGAALVGIAEPGDATDVIVSWVPLEAGPRPLRVAAGDDQVDLGVTVRDTPAPVLMYEPVPTWTGTFVRRALDDDARITLMSRTRVAPPVSVTRGDGGRLAADTLEPVGVVIVTAPERLTGAEVTLLERFVARRGGSLIVLPDVRPTGPVLRLLPPVAGERRESDPQAVGPLRAREQLVFDDDGAGVTVLARAASEAVIVSSAIGSGRVVVSGALDAWRHRTGREFANFWAALVVDAAEAAGAPLDIDVTPVLARVGEEVTIRVERRALAPLPDTLVAEGSVACGGDARPLRLWPGDRPGRFEARLRLSEPAACRVSATLDGASADAWLRVASRVRRVAAEGRLEGVIHAHGGVVAAEGSEERLLSRLREQTPRRTSSASAYPMRSPFWILPFAACLAGEWWLRRRSGER